VAIQDINRLHQLDKFPQLSSLRAERVEYPHFINDIDSPSLKDFKIWHTLQQIDLMTAECQKIFKKNFGLSFLDHVRNAISGITVHVTTVTKELEIEIEEWWDT
jgi:hypothetical protein